MKTLIKFSVNTAKRLLKLKMLQSMSSMLGKMTLSFRNSNGYETQQQEILISKSILKLLRGNRPNSGQYSNLYSILTILFKHQITTFNDEE